MSVEKEADSPNSDQFDDLVIALNKKHAIVNLGGKIRVLTENPEGLPDICRVEDLHLLYANMRVPNPKGKGEIPISRLWVEHPRRRTYLKGIGCFPGSNRSGIYNIWQGFSVVPKQGDCAKFLWHLRYVICRDNEELYRYLIGWIAHMIQFPAVKPGVAVVFRGDKGVGKDTVAAVLGKLFPRHYVRVSQGSQITGKFNAHHAYAILLHGEEAFWSGDRSTIAALNSLITSDIASIERKGYDPVQLNSCLRLLLSSNEESVVPATKGERRYAVFDVSSEKKGDNEYFKKIHDEMDLSGLAALLYYLQNYDLSCFEVRKIPRTDALAFQQAKALRGLPKWWFEILLEGDLLSVIDPKGSKALPWADNDRYEILCADLYSEYEEWHRRRRFEPPLEDQAGLGRFLASVCPPLRKITHRLDADSTANKYLFPNLSACRTNYSAEMDLPIDWAEWAPEAEPDYEDDSGLV